MPENVPSTLLKANLRWGVTNGLRVALVLSVFVTLEFLVLGPAPFTQIGVTLWTTILCYGLMGVLAGSVVGALRPQVDKAMGAAAAVGAVAGCIGGQILRDASRGGVSRKICPRSRTRPVIQMVNRCNASGTVAQRVH